MSKSIKEELKNIAIEAGFDSIGFSPAETSEQHKQDLKAFNDAGLFGTMDWMQTTQERRADPTVLWPDARSIIVLGMNYGPKQDPMDMLAYKDRGVISCYAKNRDYHDTVKKRLKRMAREMVGRFECEVKVFVDTAPVLEKPIAAQTGVGWQGKHTCVVSREYGSWLFLGEIYTTLEIEPDQPHKDHCGRCSNCLDICPTDAFLQSGQIDARKCISYLTIEYDGIIPEELALKMGNRIYGCDDCLAVCPWNKFSTPTHHKDYKSRIEFQSPRLIDLVQLDEDGFRDFFRASPIKRIKRFRFIRNVLIAIVNGDLQKAKPYVETLTYDPNSVISETASWALQKLGSRV